MTRSPGFGSSVERYSPCKANRETTGNVPDRRIGPHHPSNQRRQEASWLNEVGARRFPRSAGTGGGYRPAGKGGEGIYCRLRSVPRAGPEGVHRRARAAEAHAVLSSRLRMDPHQGVRLPLSRAVRPAETDRRRFNPRLLAEAIVRITADPAVLKRLVEAVEKPDRAAFQRLVTRRSSMRTATCSATGCASSATA